MVTIGLYKPKNAINVGSVLRAASCYNADMVAIQGRRYKKIGSDTHKGWMTIPTIETDDLKSVIPFGSIPVAVELVDNAQTIIDYIHPERAFYVFGPEDGTMGEKVLSWCRDVIYIPTCGCMNLAATVNVVLYDRLNKKIRG